MLASCCAKPNAWLSFCVVQVDNDRKEAADKTLEAYKAAQDKAMAELPSTNPIRLGLALNFSVFFYEVLNKPEDACSLAKQVRSSMEIAGTEQKWLLCDGL